MTRTFGVCKHYEGVDCRPSFRRWMPRKSLVGEKRTPPSLADQAFWQAFRLMTSRQGACVSLVTFCAQSPKKKVLGVVRVVRWGRRLGSLAN